MDLVALALNTVLKCTCQGNSDTRTEHKVSVKSGRSVNGNKLFRVVTAVKVQSCLVFLFSYELS